MPATSFFFARAAVALSSAALLIVGCGSMPASQRALPVEAVKADPSLLGRRVSVEACIGVPMSDTSRHADIVLLYPCGALNDDDLESRSLVGRLGPREVVKPLHDAGMDFAGEVGATLSGVLGKPTDTDDPMSGEVVLEIDAIRDPRQVAAAPGR